MLDGKQAVATVAVKDLAAAAKFYEDVLGLRRIGAKGDEVLIYESGGAKLFVYRSSFAGTNQATGVTWQVGDAVDAIAKDLADRGAKFERYDLPGMTREGDVHVAGELRAAWFKDPDGNIHSLVSG